MISRGGDGLADGAAAGGACGGVVLRLLGVLRTGGWGGAAAALLMGNPFLGPQPPLGDFGSFYASGQAAAAGLDPYLVYPLTMNGAVNLNAPPALLLFAAVAGVDVYVARSAWFVATVVAVAATVVALL